MYREGKKEGRDVEQRKTGLYYYYFSEGNGEAGDCNKV